VGRGRTVRAFTALKAAKAVQEPDVDWSTSLFLLLKLTRILQSGPAADILAALLKIRNKFRTAYRYRAAAQAGNLT